MTKFSWLGSTVLAKKTFYKRKKPVTSTKIPSRILSKQLSVMHLGKMYQFLIWWFYHHCSFMQPPQWNLWWLLTRVVVNWNFSNWQSTKTTKVKYNCCLFKFAKGSVLEHLSHIWHLFASFAWHKPMLPKTSGDITGIKLTSIHLHNFLVMTMVIRVNIFV